MGSGPRLYTESHVAAECYQEWRKRERWISRMEPREKAGEIENGAHRVGGCRIEIISCNWLKCAINQIVNPIPVYGHLNA
jgi:hypothetical protein